MQTSPAAILKIIGWSSLALIALAILAATWMKHAQTEKDRIQLAESRTRLLTSQKTINDFEALKSNFLRLRTENYEHVTEIKKLNLIASSLDQFVVADPDQIISQAPVVMDMTLDWIYRGYLPAGNHVFDLAIYESDSRIDSEKDNAKYSVQFEIQGPTKFEILCAGKGKANDSFEATLRLPNEPNARKQTVTFDSPFSIDGTSTIGSRLNGLPAYPNEIAVMADPKITYKRGIKFGVEELGFQTVYANKTRGFLAFVGTVHTDARYCRKTGDAVAHRYSAGHALGLDTYKTEEFKALLAQDPKLPTRMLFNDGLNEGLHQSRMRGDLRGHLENAPELPER